MLECASRRNKIASWYNKGNVSPCACPRAWGWVHFSWWGSSPKSVWLFLCNNVPHWIVLGSRGGINSLSSGCGSLYPMWSCGSTNWFGTFWTLGKIVYLRDQDAMMCFACKQKEVFICYGKKMCISLVIAQLLILLKDQITLNNLKPVSTSQLSQKT